MTVDDADQVIELFEAVLARPALYIANSADYRAFIHFTCGFQSALTVTGKQYPAFSDFSYVYKARGWSSARLGAVQEMKEKGWSDEAVVQELTILEIKTWKAFRKTLKF